MYGGEVPGSSPLISVVIPAYGVAPYIVETLESVLAQTFRDYEIIVINDGSPDTVDLEEVLKPYRSRIVYLAQHNQGPSAARNTGIRAARGLWIAMLDGDDSWERDFLASQVEILRGDPAIDVLYADTRMFGNTQLEGRTAMSLCPSKGEVTFEKLITRGCTVILSTLIARHAVLERAGMFDESMHHVEDLDLWLRIVKQGGRIAYNRRVLGRYRRRPDSLSADEGVMIQGYLRVLKKVKQQLPLTDAEATTVDRELIRQRARLAMDNARKAFASGDFPAARDYLKEANAFFRKPEFSLMLAFLYLPPGLVRWAHRIRRRYLYARSQWLGV
jgi:glycosyltransferase involved in cell wall biosynthesis